MADLGLMSVLLGLALSAYAATASVVGVKKRMPELLVSSSRSLHMTTLVTVVASLALITAFVQNDFAIKYV